MRKHLKFSCGSFFNAYSYKLLSIDDKSALLKRYYVELDSKYYDIETGNLCSMLFEDVYFWFVFAICLCHFLHSDHGHYCSENYFNVCLGRDQVQACSHSN